jgi:hypothetical protein
MKKTLLITLSLFFLDILFVDLFVFIPLVIYIIVSIIVTLFVHLKALFTKKETPITRERWVQHGIFILLAVCILIANHYNVKYAEQRGNEIIKCCEIYKQEHGVYPAKLTDLEPVCLDKIPSPKLIGVTNNYFRYISYRDGYILEYDFYFAVPLVDNYDSRIGRWRGL